MKSGLGRAEVRRLLDEHHLAPKRSLGQNFVVDPNTVERIARLARVGAGDRVVEIGAGLGSLTLALIATGATVTAVELDRGLAAVLGDVVGDAARIVIGDASKLDWHALLADDANVEHVLVANLPYNVATSMVLGILETVPEIVRMLVMVQREVGDRLAAPAGSRVYGAVSVRVAYFAEAKAVGTVSPEVFYPRPRVTSELVEIVRRATPAVNPSDVSYAELDALVRAGFAQRRKMLRRSLAGLVDDAAFEAAGIANSARAEELDVFAWGKLARCQKSIENAATPN